MPAIATNEQPESISDAAVGAFKAMIATCSKLELGCFLVAVCEVDIERLSVWLRDRRERSREAVVARDEMNDEIPVEIARGRKVPKFRRG